MTSSEELVLEPVDRLCTICARGGSKGVPGKNVREVAGRPLIAHTIDVARSSGLFDAIVVDSDSQEILDAAILHGADLAVLRPPELATDSAGKLPAMAHAVAAAESWRGRHYRLFADLDVTSPLRLPEDVTETVRLVESGRFQNAFTVAPARHSPYFNLVERDEAGRVSLSKPVLSPVLSRQASPACYDINGSVYVWWRDDFMADPYLFGEATGVHVMPRDRSVDIDDELDFRVVEILMQERAGV